MRNAWNDAMLTSLPRELLSSLPILHSSTSPHLTTRFLETLKVGLAWEIIKSMVTPEMIYFIATLLVLDEDRVAFS